MYFPAGNELQGETQSAEGVTPPTAARRVLPFAILAFPGKYEHTARDLLYAPDERTTLQKRRVALVATGAAVLFGIVLLGLYPREGLEDGLRAPNFSIYDSSGDPVQLADFRGQHLFVNFWGPWCAPCIREAESLYDLEQKLAGEVQFLYVGINGFYRDEQPLDPVEVAGGVQAGLDRFLGRLREATLVKDDPVKNADVVEHLLKTTMFDFRGYWQRQFRARTNERYGIPVTYLIDPRGRIRLIVHTAQEWLEHEQMMRDFVAGKSLAGYDDRFVIPQELLPTSEELPAESSQAETDPSE